MRSILLLFVALQFLRNTALAQLTLLPMEETRVGGVVRRVVVTGDFNPIITCCIVRDHKTSLFQWPIGKDEPPELKFQDNEECVVFDAKGNIGVVLTKKDEIALVDTESWTLSGRFQGHQSQVACVDTLQKGILIGFKAQSVGRMSRTTGKIYELPGSECSNAISVMKLSGDGKVLALGCNRGEVAFYDLEKEKKFQVVDADPLEVRGFPVTGLVIWSTPDHALWTRSNGSLLAYNRVDKSPQLLGRTAAGASQEIMGLPHLKAVAIVDREDVKILSIEDGRVIGVCEGQHGVIWSLATAGTKLVAGTWHGSVLVWELAAFR